MSNATENVTVKLNADASDLNRLVAGFDKLIAQEKDLLAAFEKANSAYTRQMAELQALQKLEAQLIDLKNKENNPALLASYNTALDNTAKKIAAIKAAYSAEIAIVDALRAKQNDLKAAIDKAADPAKVKQLTAELNNTATATAKLSAGTQNVSGSMLSLGNAVKTAGALIAAEFAVSRVRQFADAVIDTTAEMQGLRKAIDFASGGQGEKVFAELGKQADELGLSLHSLASGYKVFSAAFIGTNIPVEEQLKMFGQINQALTVMQVPADKATNAYLALGQMMSKGTVQAEELKGQLGDALHGAFNFAAEAMGVTTQQLGKMMEKGEIMATDFLPKFAALLETKFAGGIAKASDSLQSSINRQDNAWLKLRETLGKAILPAYQDLLSGTSAWLEILTRSIAGEQLSVDQTERLSAALSTLKTVLSAMAGLFLTMTNSGKALASGLINLAVAARASAVATVETAKSQGVATAASNAWRNATTALTNSLSALRGVLAGLGIGAAIALVLKLYEELTKTDARAERTAENWAQFNEAMRAGKADAEAEVATLNGLFEVLKNVNSSTEDRAKALYALKTTYSAYLGGLSLESATLAQIEAAQRSATRALYDSLIAKVNYEVYTQQLVKQKNALLELAAMQERLNAAVTDAYGPVNGLGDAMRQLGGYLGQPFGLGVRSALDDLIDKAARLKADADSTQGAIAILIRDAGGLDKLLVGGMPTPTAGTGQNVEMSKAEKKAIADRLAEEERLRRRLAELNEQIRENTIEDLAEIQLAHIESTRQIEINELHSHAARLAAQGKLTNEMIRLIGLIQDRIEKLAELNTIDVLQGMKLAELEKNIQEQISEVKQQFLQGRIASEAEMNRTINAITLKGEQDKLGIIQAYSNETADEERTLQNRLVAQTEDGIQRRLKLEQENFEARQRFLQQGDYEMQEQALKAHFKRMEAQMIAHNRETQNPLAVNANTGEVGLTKAQRIALERDKLEAELQLNQQHNKELYALGLTRNQQEAMLGHTIRQKEVSELEAYYEKRLELARKSGQDEKIIEAEKEQALRQLHAKRVETDLGYQQQALGNIQQAAQAASQVVTEQTQNEINMLSQRYDRAISLAQTKAEKDARFYGENSKQARKSAQDLAHVELEKQHAIQKAEDEGHKKQAKLAALNKAIATAQAVISTAMAVVKYLAMTELFPVNIELATAAGIAGAAQVATIIAQPIPQYAKGTPLVEGGTPGRDSVHAMLMPGERVIPTAQNRQYWGALEAIRTGAIPAAQMNGFAMSFGAMAAGPSVPMPRTREPERPWFDDARLVAAIKEKEHVNVNVSADEAGFAVMVERQHSRNRMIDKRFSYNG